jgi:hypothetical protein
MTSTDTFPKMGDDGMAGLVNVSGQRSPYTTERPRGGPTSDDMGGGGAGGLSHTMIHEAHGPTFRPMMTRGWGPEYPDTGRGLRTVPSSVGNRDFWDARARAGE